MKKYLISIILMLATCAMFGQTHTSNNTTAIWYTDAPTTSTSILGQPSTLVSSSATGGVTIMSTFAFPATTSAPVVKSATAIGQRSVTLGWTEATAGITTFNIYRGVAPNGEGLIPYASVTGSQLSYVDSTVNNGTTYYYFITAVLGVESLPSSEVKAVVPTAPASPSGVTAVVQ